jgi:hypothetical protein
MMVLGLAFLRETLGDTGVSQKIKVRFLRARDCMFGEREGGLVEGDVARNDDPIGGHVEASITFVFRRVTKKRAQRGARHKFVGGDGGEVRITTTSKNPKVVIGGWGAKKHMVRGGEIESFGGVSVDEIGGGMESFDPIVWGMLEWKRRVRVTLLMVRIERSALPFCWDV